MCSLKNTSCKHSGLFVVLIAINRLYWHKNILYSRECVDVETLSCSRQWGELRFEQDSFFNHLSCVHLFDSVWTIIFKKFGLHLVVAECMNLTWSFGSATQRYVFCWTVYGLILCLVACYCYMVALEVPLFYHFLIFLGASIAGLTELKIINEGNPVKP